MMLATPEDIGKNNPFNVLICFNTMDKIYVSLRLYHSSHTPVTNLDQDPTRLTPRGIWGEDDVTWCVRRVVQRKQIC